MKLRVQPWFTDSCTVFLNNLFKWYPKYLGQPVSVLEWGGGNSSIYFLQKQCRLLTIECDDGYIDDLVKISRSLGFKAIVTTNLKDSAEQFNNFDLTILKATAFDEIGESVFELIDWSIVVNDGISRKEVIETLMKHKAGSIVVLDNAEYCANWGKLERSSAHPDRVKSYRQMLRDPFWRHYLFEQPEGREGHSSPDFSGWEAPHRWLSAVLWPHDHLLAKLMVSHIGLPLVTRDGLHDEDIATLPERCPFDRNQMKWLVSQYSDVFTLPRDFE